LAETGGRVPAEYPNSAPVQCSACQAALRDVLPGGWAACDACGVTTVRCSSCGLEQPAPVQGGRQGCERCGCALPLNSWRLGPGVRRYQRTGNLPADLQPSIEAFRASVIERQGGRIADDGTVTGLDAIVAGRIRLLIDAEVLRLLNKREVVTKGVDSKAGGRANDRMLAAMDRWMRIADSLPVPQPQALTLDAVIAEYERGPLTGAGRANGNGSHDE
jgi:hypothetical protein